MNPLHDPNRPKSLTFNNTEVHFLPQRASKLGLTLYSNSFRETSFYHGAYSKGGFNSPLNTSPKSTTTILPPQPKTLSVQPSFMNASTISTRINKSIDIDPEIIHEFPFKDEIISREPSKKLQKLLQPQKSPCRILPKLQVLTKKASGPSPNASINTYLDILQTSPSLQTETFSSKLHGKTKSVDQPEFEGIRGLIDKQLSEHMNMSKNPSGFSVQKVFSPKKTSLAMMENSHQGLFSNTVSANSSLIFSSDNLMTSPSKKKNNVSVSMRSSIQSFCSVETNKEESVAKELAEEIASSYKIYTVNAAKNKDIQVKVKHLLQSEGVWQHFQAKPGKSQPLSVRIYHDLMGYNEEEQFQENVKTVKAGKISLVGSPRIKIVRAETKALRLVPHKYKIYKMLSQELTKINLDYKVQEVQSLEGKLIQAKEEFDKRRDKVLYNVKKKDAQLFRVLKTHCDSTENTINMYTGCSDTFLEQMMAKEDKEITIVNKNLDGVMKNWRRHLGNS